MSLRDTLLKRTGLLNTIWYQRWHWARQLRHEVVTGWERLGKGWGDPEAADDYWGNYRSVRDRLLEALTPQTCVVEIGSYGGKWTQYLLPARNLICVDLFREAGAALHQRFPDTLNLFFYQTSGDELRGIPNRSVDLVFSMDTLVRVPRRAIRRYLEECRRILVPGGRILLHLPCDALPRSKQKVFTSLSFSEIYTWAEEVGFVKIDCDLYTLSHGVLLSARVP